MRDMIIEALRARRHRRGTTIVLVGPVTNSQGVSSCILSCSARAAALRPCLLVVWRVRTKSSMALCQKREGHVVRQEWTATDRRDRNFGPDSDQGQSDGRQLRRRIRRSRGENAGGMCQIPRKEADPYFGFAEGGQALTGIGSLDAKLI